MKRNLMSGLQQRSRSTFLKCRVPSGAAHSPAANGRSPQPGPPTTAPPAVWGAAALPSARAQPHVARPSDAIPNHAGQAPWPPSRSTGRSKKASHQFPGGKGDPRDEMVQIIAREAKAANVGLEIQIYPGASLFKPNDQWNAMVNGQLDISSFPLDYASGKVRDFGATLMPGLVRSHDRAARLANSPFMKDIKAKIEKAGVIVLADAWLAGAVASKKGS